MLRDVAPMALNLQGNWSMRLLISQLHSSMPYLADRAVTKGGLRCIRIR